MSSRSYSLGGGSSRRGSRPPGLAFHSEAGGRRSLASTRPSASTSDLLRVVRPVEEPTIAAFREARPAQVYRLDLTSSRLGDADVIVLVLKGLPRRIEVSDPTSRARDCDVAFDVRRLSCELTAVVGLDSSRGHRRT